MTGQQWGMRDEYRAECVAVSDIMQAMHDELCMLRAKLTTKG